MANTVHQKMKNLGILLRHKYSQVRTKDDLDEAIKFHRTVLKGASSSITTQILADTYAIQCCTIVSDWHQAFEAVGSAVRLISKLVFRSPERSDMH